MSFRCAMCDQDHEGVPDVGFAKPDPWFGVPEAERERRTFWKPDTCIVDDDFFVRGVLYLPVIAADHPLGLGVWVSQSRANFERYAEETPDSPLGPTFGFLSTHLACYEADTFALETTVHFNGRTRPSIEVHGDDHVLAREQREGITLARAWEIVHRCGG